jgi:hypothetical protein
MVLREKKEIERGVLSVRGDDFSVQGWGGWVHCEKGLAVFPSPAGMSLTKLSLGGNN